jgi:NADPH2:quinone reductase
MVGDVHKNDEGKDLGFVFTRYIARGLEQGWFKPQKQVVVPGGLGGIQEALDNLKAGKANAVKYVFRIADTQGLSP